MTDATLPALPEPPLPVAWRYRVTVYDSWTPDGGIEERLDRSPPTPYMKATDISPLVTLQSAIAYAEERVAQERERLALMGEEAVSVLMLPDSPQFEGDDRHIVKRTMLGFVAAIRKNTADTKGTA